jgi:hypothetical protein
MKQHLSSEDVTKITDSQKQHLRELWQPEKNDMAFASVCKDVINETFDIIPFVIGSIRIYDRHEDEIIEVEKILRMTTRPSVTLQRLRLIDDKFYENKEHLFSDNVEINDEADEDSNDINFEYEEPEDFFALSDCLPLLNIGQMIEILNFLNTNQGGYSISVPDTRYEYGEQKYGIHNLIYDEHENEELADLLWEVIIELL